MSDIQIIGKDEQPFAIVYNNKTDFKIDTIQKALRWAMLALPDDKIIGVIPCVPAILAMWDRDIQIQVRKGAYFHMKREDLSTPEELGLTVLLNPPVQTELILPENEIIFGSDGEIT